MSKSADKKIYDRAWHKARRSAKAKHSIDGVAIPKPMVDAARLVASKAQDYNSNVGRGSYFPFGLKSYVHTIHTKSQRLVNLAATDKAPNHESVRDTCLDLINYASFLAEALESGEVK